MSKFIKQDFIALLSFSGSLTTKCMSLINKELKNCVSKTYSYWFKSKWNSLLTIYG